MIKKSIYKLPVEIIKKLKEQAKELTDKDNDVNLTMSSLLENCVTDLINEGIDPKIRDDLIKKDFQFFISESARLKLKAASMESGYSMTELIIKAYELFNPDVNPSYDHLR